MQKSFYEIKNHRFMSGGNSAALRFRLFWWRPF